MPVVVTGADEALGRAVLLALRADPDLDLRATVSGWAAARELVALGVPSAVSDLGDAERLGAVLAGAHTVVHLAGPDPLDSVALLLEAAQDSGLRRVVTVSPASGTRAYGGSSAGLALLAASGYQVVVVTGDRTTADEALVAALVAADRVGSDRLPPAGTVAVVGPDDPLLAGSPPR